MQTKEINKQTILLENTVDYVNGVYHLDDAYKVTQFRNTENAIHIALNNGALELNIKIKGMPKVDLERKTAIMLEELEDKEVVEVEE